MNNTQLIIGGKSEEYERHDADFYPTPPDCTHALMRFLRSRGLINDRTSIWECACGDGAMSEVFKKYSKNVVSTDLREDAGYGIQSDFLKCTDKLADVVITNPPFDVSELFIRKCHYFDLDLYAMLLKTQYWHSKGRIKLFNETKPSFVLPLTWRPNFSAKRGSAPLMDVIWTVWVKGDHETKFIPLTRQQITEQPKAIMMF